MPPCLSCQSGSNSLRSSSRRRGQHLDTATSVCEETKHCLFELTTHVCVELCCSTRILLVKHAIIVSDYSTDRQKDNNLLLS